MFFNYSFEYWKFFYDEYKKHPQGFYEYWEAEKQKAFNNYDKYIIGDSETFKLQVDQGNVNTTY